MKRTSIFTLLFLLSFSFVSAQIGLKGGLNWANLVFDADNVTVETDSKVGINLGVFYESSLSEKFTFRPTVAYSGKGAKAVDSEETITIDYIDVNFDFIYRFGTGDNSFAINLGPYFGFLASAKDGSNDIKDDLNSTDFGFTLGVAYEMKKLIIGLAGGQSAGNITAEDAELFDVKNSFGTFYIGYRI